MMTLQVIRQLAVYDTFHDFGDDGEQGNRVVVIWLAAARFFVDGYDVGNLPLGRLHPCREHSEKRQVRGAASSDAHSFSALADISLGPVALPVLTFSNKG